GACDGVGPCYGGAAFWDNASLTSQVVPVPAAAWLFGSALAGLVVARRKK
ncbi:MAG: VPLPA-CTERM sorting domain-containing protein, partial [Pseudomonadales bacterium]